MKHIELQLVKVLFYCILCHMKEARGGTVGWGTALQAGRFDSRWVSLRFFYWLNPSGWSMTLGSTRSLKEMGTRGISWGDKERQPYHQRPLSWNMGASNFWNPQGQSRDCFTFITSYEDIWGNVWMDHVLLCFKYIAVMSRGRRNM
jgi:hypothetical protein